MAKITLQFKDTKSGVDISLDAASFKRIKKSSHKLSPAEELAVRMFIVLRQAEGLMRENDLGGPPDTIDECLPVRGKACCGGSCDCEK
jgi:hypothetical protein